jgi:pentatricopeptide repeat protein
MRLRQQGYVCLILFGSILIFLIFTPVTPFVRPLRKASRITASSLSPLQQHPKDNSAEIKKKNTEKRRFSRSSNKQNNFEAIQFNKWLIRFLRQEDGDVEEAQQLLLQRVKEKQPNIDYDTISFNLVLNAWARRRSVDAAKRADKLLQILLQAPTLIADTYSYSAVLNAYAKSGGKRKAALRAEELLYQMENSMKVDTDFCHNAVINCWSVSGDLDAGRRAQSWLTKLEENKREPTPTRISYNACIKAWARSENGAPKAHNLLLRMQSLGGTLSPDKISYSTCIDAYCKCTTGLVVAAEKAEELLKQMEQASPENEEMRPDVVAYTSVLHAYAKAGIDTNRAMLLIDRMQKHANQQPNTNFLNTLLHLFAKANKLDHAETLLNSMKESGMADKISYTAVISANANVGNATRARELLSELESLYKSSKHAERFLPTTKTFASVLHAIAKGKDCKSTDLNEVDSLLDQMNKLYKQTKNPELYPNTVVYSLVFLIYSNSQDPRAPERAEDLMTRMNVEKKNGNPHVRPDATTYAYLINTFTKSKVHNSAEMARKILQEVEEGYKKGDNDLKPTKLLYSAVLQAHAKSASPEGADLAEELLRRTKDLFNQGKLYAKPTALYYNAVIDAHARSKRGVAGALRAEELLNELEQRYRAGDVELTPTTRSYNAAILAWKNSNSEDAPERAEALLKRMNERYGEGDQNCRPDRVTINSIIGVWAKCRREGAPERAETFLKFMENLYYHAGDASFKPDNISFNTVIDAYSLSSSENAAHRADELYSRMKKLHESGDQGLEPDIITLTSLRNAWERSECAEAHEKLKHIRQLIANKRKERRHA